jgi:hypothetical protein
MGENLVSQSVLKALQFLKLWWGVKHMLWMTVVRAQQRSASSTTLYVEIARSSSAAYSSLVSDSWNGIPEHPKLRAAGAELETKGPRRLSKLGLQKKQLQ